LPNNALPRASHNKAMTPQAQMASIQANLNKA
jgi:hypothetical protein